LLTANWLKGLLLAGDILAVVLSGMVAGYLAGGDVRLGSVAVVAAGLVLALYLAEAY